MKAEEMDKESEKFLKITMKVLTMQLNSISVMDIMAYGGQLSVLLLPYQNTSMDIFLCQVRFISFFLLVNSFYL